MILTMLIACAVTGSSCNKDAATPQDALHCPGESVLVVYHNQEAVVTLTQKDTYCLIADSANIAKGSYLSENYLVPSSALPAQYQVEGLHVVFSGRKKNCYGLTTSSSLRTAFGYKVEIDTIRAKPKGD
jgi:hypothetical protein